ncbi:MAG: hypothetical protein JWP27_1438 [Flaviaesturariibacter sp.]|nr:hypothetical protein [Flaviaesturariibacter sp.]
MKNLIWLLLAAGLVSSCRSTRKIGTAISRKDTVQASSVTPDGKADSLAFIQASLRQVSANHIDYTTFSAKVNIDYRDASNKNYDVNAVVRIYRDSAIWISANAILGIEALRAYITRDSVKILDKLNKTYTARSVDYLQDVTALPLDLHTIQDLLIGNPVYLDSNHVVSYSRGPGTVALLSFGEWFKNLLTIREGDGALQRSRLDDLNPARNRTADLTYSDYETRKGPLFSTKRKITITEAKQLDIKLDFKQYDFNGEVSFPFSVPKNFKRN